MRRCLQFIAVFLFIPASCSFAQSNQTESLTIATYYPSPSGVYASVRLFPRNALPSVVNPGVIYYNNTTDMIRYYNMTGSWVNLTSADRFEGKAMCYLQTYGTSGYTPCTAGYYTVSGLAQPAGGKMLCCTVDHIN
jgi:hypothetical protein